MLLKEKIIKEKNILICGDDKRASNFLQGFLRGEGYDAVDIARSRDEALEKIAKERYQLVLLDIKLQGMNGIQTLQRIKEIDKNIAVIIIADPSQVELAEKAVKNGAYDYVLKPFDLGYLKLAILTKVLADSK